MFCSTFLTDLRRKGGGGRVQYDSLRDLLGSLKRKQLVLRQDEEGE